MSLQKSKKHIPVLMQEVMDILAPEMGDRYLDLTAGYGGHASEILDITKSGATLVDRDKNAISELEDKFGNNDEVVLLNEDFLQACRSLSNDKQQFDLILVDLGVSSPHLDNASRGFSLSENGPLDMRMDESQELSAKTVVNTYNEQELTRVIREYGEEPKASAMARLIVKSRPFKTTTQLAEIGKKVWPGYSRSHPSTRLFQAIRIEVNDELGQLEKALPLMASLLSPGGRLAVVSFHSLEDRIVKKFFREQTGNRYDVELRLITKRPQTASPGEIDFNPRSRSAKIRGVVKIKTKKRKDGLPYADTG